MPYFKNGQRAQCPQCGMNMSLWIDIIFGIKHWNCNWQYCSEYGIDVTEGHIKANLIKTPAEIRAYRISVAPPTSNSAYIGQQSSRSKKEMKEVQISSLYADTIIELHFITLPRRGWFKENIQPIIDIIKTAIPASAREYDPATFKWQIAVEYWLSLEQILLASEFTIKRIKSTSGPANIHVPEAYAESFYHEQTVITTVETKESIAVQLASLLGIHEDLASIELIALKKKYREMARKYHPDLGGDSALMSELNRVWTIYNAGDKVQ